jgi:hypothetical protein
MDKRMVLSQNISGITRSRQRARQAVDQSLRELSANLMRVAIGAGDANCIAAHALAYVGAMMILRDELGGELPTVDTIAASIAICSREDTVGRLGRNEQSLTAENKIIKGALEAAASRLLGQELQESAGLYGIYSAVWMLVNIQSRRRSNEVGASPTSQL